MIKRIKKHLGNFLNKEEAARMYDRVALQNLRRKAKTNFYYTKEQVEKIISEALVN
jgi:hypothetical protein